MFGHGLLLRGLGAGLIFWAGSATGRVTVSAVVATLTAATSAAAAASLVVLLLTGLEGETVVILAGSVVSVVVAATLAIATSTVLTALAATATLVSILLLVLLQVGGNRLILGLSVSLWLLSGWSLLLRLLLCLLGNSLSQLGWWRRWTLVACDNLSLEGLLDECSQLAV